MRVHITGIAGFLGSHLAEHFISEGHQVQGNDTLIGGSDENVPDGATWKWIDCVDYQQLAGYMRGCDVVYHTAALAYEGLSVFSPFLINDNIYMATTGVVNSAILAGVDRVVFCSSMSRYGTNNVPFTEDMDPRPQDPYAISKVASERLVRTMGDIHGYEHVIAVPHNIIGPRQKYDDPFRNVASIFANRMLQGKQPIIYGDGSQKRCFSFVRDCVDPLAQMATDDRVEGEVINIGPDDEFITINELAETIADIIGFELDPIYRPDRPAEVELANCSADKARELLGYEPSVDLREGLAKMIREIEPKEFEYHLDVELQTDITPSTWTDEEI